MAERARYLCQKCPWAGASAPGGACPQCGRKAEPLTEKGERRKSKYAAKPCTIDGHRFPSKREARRYTELRTLERAGKITGLELQPKFPCVVNGVKVCDWIGDFAYFEAGSDTETIEDAKGFRTKVYRIKKKLVEAIYGIRIKEV